MSTTPPNLVDVVLNQVASRTGRRVWNLRVEVGGDGVVLRGRAPSYHIKQLAQQGVRDALPHIPLENAIVVD